MNHESVGRPGWIGPGGAFAILGAMAAIAGSLAMAAGLPMGRWLLWVGKPLATLAILLLAWRAPEPVSPRYRRRVVLALAACLVGDVCLMLPGGFVPGLACFAVAQACFIAAFVTDARFAAPAWPWVTCLLYAALAGGLLWRGLAPALHLPVLVYMGLLATMGGQAMARALQRDRAMDADARAARRAALGAAWFMLSDSLLAWDRFRNPLPLAALWVLATYYVAIGLIARSVDRAPSR